MNFNDLLKAQAIDPKMVIVMRHRPHEPELRKVLPWLAAERPATYNAYQQTQNPRAESALKALEGTGHVASFIGHRPGQALFVGLYRIGASRPLTVKQFWEVPALLEMRAFGMEGFIERDGRATILWFELALTEIYAQWKGKLVVGWPPPERSWWRQSHRNDFPVLAILEDSALDAEMPDWSRINLSSGELALLPSRWRTTLSQWRGVYFIYDKSDGKGYVGSAYGLNNLLGRWQNYAASGHGGNRLLRERNPKNFQFTILQRVSPDMDADDVIRLESSWKERLHTRFPDGLNDN